MLKTQRDEQVWLISQPAHAALAGLMAAHWGNEQFSALGELGSRGDPDRVRREVVLAVTEHDNGWWEWEADPPLAQDRLPLGLDEAGADPEDGMERWRRGISRFSECHPYASLLIADHADWLYAAQFDASHPPELVHPLHHGRDWYASALADRVAQFRLDVQGMKGRLRQRLESDAAWSKVFDPERRAPHSRLLQFLDALSLALCSAVIAPVTGEARGLGEDHIVFHEVPRQGWDDRVAVELAPAGDGRVTIDPYPFDEAPLTVTVPARVVAAGDAWRGVPLTLKAFRLLRRQPADRASDAARG